MDGEDRRGMHYIITQDAGGLISEINILKNKFYERLFEGISEEEKELYKKTTYKIMENLENM